MFEWHPLWFLAGTMFGVFAGFGSWLVLRAVHIMMKNAGLDG